MFNDRLIITLCGSTRFKREYEEANKRLTLDGCIVLSVGCFGHADAVPLTPRQKARLDGLHIDKILMSDEIFVINPGGYIGISTRSEIRAAYTWGKSIKFLEPMDIKTALGSCCAFCGNIFANEEMETKDVCKKCTPNYKADAIEREEAKP